MTGGRDCWVCRCKRTPQFRRPRPEWRELLPEFPWSDPGAGTCNKCWKRTLTGFQKLQQERQRAAQGGSHKHKGGAAKHPAAKHPAAGASSSAAVVQPAHALPSKVAKKTAQVKAAKFAKTTARQQALAAAHAAAAGARAAASNGGGNAAAA